MWPAIRMSGEAASRRLRQLSAVLSARTTVSLRRVSSKSADDDVLRIGDISLKIRSPRRPEYVPVKYIPAKIPQTVLKQLRWMLQKDQLGQDVFLIGPPGPHRRHLAMMYLELTKKEGEYVSLSRDTTEADLKQRREIRKGTAYHIDQCAVQAATAGRVLVLEGIEKAERNVLPILNNLLENREMQLDDGRFLMAAPRYDKLLEIHSQEELDAWSLVRVSEHFRVIALGLPVPTYQGNPLDPPLRSRFQARTVQPLPYQDQLEMLQASVEGVPPEILSKLVSFASTLRSSEASMIGLPDFPVDNLPAILHILSQVPGANATRLLHMLYPSQVMLGKEGQTAVSDALKSLELENPSMSSQLSQVHLHPQHAMVTLETPQHTANIEVSRGTASESLGDVGFVSTPYHEQLLAEMMQTHLVKDFCIIGPRGCGKTMLVKQFAALLGYHIEPVMLYQDMTSRDLLQQRRTLPSGDTTWQPSPLVTAALEGSLAVLDGLHRVNAGTLAVLHRLVHDRELSLFDGTRLLRHDRYDALQEELGLAQEEMKERGMLRIHPSFRVVALSEPPVIGSSSQQWLSPELLTLFLYHDMRPLSRSEEDHLLHRLVPSMADMKPILELTHKLRQAADPNLQSVAGSLSTRQLLRLAKRMAKYPEENAYELVHKACLASFLPRLARKGLEDELDKMGLSKPVVPLGVEALEKAVTCEVKAGMLRIGGVEIPVHNADNQMKVPDVLFYENPQHVRVMEAMLKDFLLDEHLLLVGNQGVGKNKIVDRFLQLLNRPREYLQLHRDTTVQTLTLQPSVHDGVIVYEDSPLVRAVKQGHILVIDEADKAPTNVTCILKTLVESGEMHLADGRRILTAGSGLPPGTNVILAHPDFRMIVLANRPGFPFLGNDFFGALGDIFSCHGIHNPDMTSELAMLRQYGPDVPDAVLRKLVLAFGELRDMADQGLITYPYSTREVVNMVRHLQAFPDEGVSSVVRNVFDFDAFNPELRETIIQTLHKHGIPIGADASNISLAKEYPLPSLEKLGQLQIRRPGSAGRHAACAAEEKTVTIKGPVRLDVQSFPLQRTEARSLLFTEQVAHWSIPLHETSAIADVAVCKACDRQPTPGQQDSIHVATLNPVSLYTMEPMQQKMTCIDLYDVFPSNTGATTKRRIQIAPLGFPLDNNVLLHDETSNIILNIDVESGDVRRFEIGSFLSNTTAKINRSFRQHQGIFKMCGEFSHTSDGLTLFYKQDSQNLDVLNVLEGRCQSVDLPIKVHAVHMLSRTDWMLIETDSNRVHMLVWEPQDASFTLQAIEPCPTDSGPAGDPGLMSILGALQSAGTSPLSTETLSRVMEQSIQAPNRLLVAPDSLPMLAVGLPELSTIDVHGFRTAPELGGETPSLQGTLGHLVGRVSKSPRMHASVVQVPEAGQVVRTVPARLAPEEALPQGVKPHQLSGFLEVLDLCGRKLRYVPIPGVSNHAVYNQWFYSGQDVTVAMAPLSNAGLVTVDSGGGMRLWETAWANLEKSATEWKSLIGQQDSKPIQVTYEKELGKQATSPKHGKVDASGDPHVGGNTWAGGTGGRDTAGLGGIGGPYRLDAGHDVTQVPDWEKEAVPEEVKRAAREMGQKAFKERLREIQMSEYDAELYERFSGNVKRQVQSLRVVLDNLQAKGKERQWLRHQTHGDLDEAKLIEGLTGEKAIYRRRGEKEPELGSPQQKPKVVELLCDVSGSMYRFNGYDGRLEREMEAMVMVMEALDGYEQKVKYTIVGHSGEGPAFDIVKVDKPPKNNKDRLDVVKTLHAHSQFCISGDSTVEATQRAVRSVGDIEGDENFVIVLSDANLERYGIPAHKLASALTANEDVNAYVIFIGSLGDQAVRLQKQLPAGRAFICMDTKNLPNILQQIFTSAMLTAR